jgi:5-methylcytosine-specific restriction endonuclease McrA
MDTNLLSNTARLSDVDLLARVQHLAHRERQATVALIAYLAEVDVRRLYLGEGYASMFTYCTHALHLSESAAYRRIEAARAARKFPVILERLEDGSLNLTTVRLLAPHLTEDNYRDLLDATRGASKLEVEELVARMRPQPPAPDAIRNLPSSSPTPMINATMALLAAALAPTDRETKTTSPPAPVPEPACASPGVRPAIVTPLAPERYKVSFTASAALHAKLRQVQALLRHQIPNGDLEKVFDRALTVLLRELTKQKAAVVERPRNATPRRAEEREVANSRHIPAVVKRTVWARDAGQCAFVTPNGRRCAEHGFLEFHHVVPYADGGNATEANIELRCRAHNGYEAKRELGERASKWRGGARVCEPEATYSCVIDSPQGELTVKLPQSTVQRRARPGPILLPRKRTAPVG